MPALGAVVPWVIGGEGQVAHYLNLPPMRAHVSGSANVNAPVEVRQLERQLAKAQLIIGIQKKAAQLLAIDLGAIDDES